MNRRCAIAVCGCLLAAFSATAAARDDNLVAVGNTESVVIGTNVVNPQRLRAEDREALLDRLQGAGVRVIRAPLAPGRNADDYRSALDFIRRAYDRGIRTDLIVGLQWRTDAQRRPAVGALPNMWSSYPLSAADPTRFRAIFEPLFDRLEGMGIVFAALELGNEINWAGFNGDFPVPGEGKVFGREDLARDPEARRVAAGFRAYLQTLRVLKDIRDGSRLNRRTPILSAGLADPGPAGPRHGPKTDAVTIGAALEYLRENGIDALVDGYGVHTYPRVAGGAAARLQRLEQDALADCRPQGRGKPCWITEWGLPVEGPPCPVDDAPLSALIQEMRADFRQFVRQGRLRGILYYAWADDRYGVYRCGRLIAAGRLALAPSFGE